MILKRQPTWRTCYNWMARLHLLESQFQVVWNKDHEFAFLTSPQAMDVKGLVPHILRTRDEASGAQIPSPIFSRCLL